LFWCAPRISMQSFRVGVMSRSLFPIFEPTVDSSKLRGGSQIFQGTHAAGVLRSAAAERAQKASNPR
jgi:hypothetical protein